jgi:hypothetical protein
MERRQFSFCDLCRGGTRLHWLLISACFLALGFGLGILVTLKAVGFS